MRRISLTMIIFGLLSCGALISGCSSGPSDEELKTLENLKAQAAQLDDKVKVMQRDKAGVDKEIADKNGKLQQCQSDQEAVKKAMGK
jgi:outer membrane murein-binding lipoprotein Lpp